MSDGHPVYVCLSGQIFAALRSSMQVAQMFLPLVHGDAVPAAAEKYSWARIFAA